MNGMKMVAYWLVIIGGLNWGLVGIGGFAGSDWNVIHLILGFSPAIEWIVYVLVGLSALWLVFAKKGMGGSGSGMAM